MSSAVLCFAFPRLDLTPRRDPVAARLDPAWSVRLPGIRHMALRRYGEHVLVQERAPGKSLRILEGSGESATSLEIAVVELSPSAIGPLCLTTQDGTAYFWAPGAAPQLVWQADEPGDYAVTSIGGHNLLIQQFLGRDVERIWAIDARGGRELWRLDESPIFLSALPSGLQFLRRDEPKLECRDAVTGALRWSSVWSGSVHRIGLVDDVLWSPGDSELLRIDCSIGRVLPPVAVEKAFTPGGLIDERGIFHCCNGLNYQTLDLRDGGRRLSFAEFRLTAEGPTIGAGPARMVVATDGRLIFSDQRQGVWVVHPERPTEPKLIWRATGLIVGIAAWREQVLVAEDAGTIIAFGASAE